MQIFKCSLLNPDVTQNYRLIPESPQCKETAYKIQGRINDPKLRLQLQRANEDGHAVFFTVNQLDGKGTKRENVTHTKALFIDVDTPHTRSGLVDKLKDAPPPSLIIESSPLKYHVYWVLEEPEPVTDTWFTARQKHLIEMFGSDKAVHDLPRIMRYPGFYHQKREPFLVRVIRDTCITYSRRALDDWLRKPTSLPGDRTITQGRYDNLDFGSSDFSLSECALRAEVDLTGHLYQDTLEIVRKTPEGFRNNTLNCLSFDLFRSIMNGDIAVTLGRAKHGLLDAAQGNGLTLEESTATVKSAYNSARKKPKVSQRATADDFTLVDPPTKGMLSPLSGFKKEWMNFLWPGWLPRGECTLFAAQGAVGKSTIALDIACRVSRGATWPQSNVAAEKGATVYITSEDHYTKVLLPKIELHGGDPALILKFTIVDESQGEMPLDYLAKSLDSLEQEIKNYQNQTGIPVQLIVIDPIGLSLGGDENKASDVTKTARGLNLLCTNLNCACIAIHHNNKSIEGTAVNKVAGSRAFTTAFRTVLGVSMDDETGEGVFGKIKANLTQKKGTFKYKLLAEPVTFDNGLSRDFVRLEWGDYEPEELLESAVQEHSADEATRSLNEMTVDFLQNEAFRKSPVVDAKEMLDHWFKYMKLPRSRGNYPLKTTRARLVKSGGLAYKRVGNEHYYALNESDFSAIDEDKKDLEDFKFLD